MLSGARYSLRPCNVIPRRLGISTRKSQLIRWSRVVNAEPPDKGGPDRTQVEQTVRELRKASVNRETAQKIMSIWKENGITDDPDELQKLYRQRGNDAYVRFGIQIVLDICASFAVRTLRCASPHPQSNGALR
jgi:hypothetical protein